MVTKVIPIDGEHARLLRRRLEHAEPFREGPGDPDLRVAIAWQIEFDHPAWQAKYGSVDVGFDSGQLLAAVPIGRRADTARSVARCRAIIVKEFAALASEGSQR